MGQFYKTSKPQFVDDFMYKPPWELAKEVILAKDKRVNNEINMAGELGKVLNFETLDFDKEAANNKKVYYKTKIDDLVNKIKQDPTNYSKYSSDLNTLRQEMSTDFTNGDIGNMTKTFAGAQGFIKDNSKLKDKDAIRYTAGYNAFYKNAKEKRETNKFSDPTGVWASEQLMPTIDLGEGFQKFLKSHHTDVESYATVGGDGRYIYKNKGTKEELTLQKVQELQAEYIGQVPNIKEYLGQTNRIGLDDPLVGLANSARGYAYKKTTTDSSKTTDSYGVQAQGLKNSMNLADYKEAIKDGGGNGNLKPSGQILESLPATLAVGNILASKMTAGKTDSNGKPISIYSPMILGWDNLVGKKIITQAQANYNQKMYNDKFKKPEDFAGYNVVFIPQKTFKIGKETYHAGQSYTKTMKQAQRELYVSGIVPNSVQPFYETPEANGLSFKLQTKVPNYTDKNGVDHTFETNNNALRAVLVPPGSAPGVNYGISVFTNN